VSLLKVLVADDHAIVRSGLAFLINQQADFEVVAEAANGNEAFLKIEQYGIDLIILDLNMPPGESGLITTQRIHERYPDVGIIILSMHEEQAYIDQAIKNGAAAYILKSSSDAELLTALKTVARHKSYIDQNIILTKTDIEKINTPDLDADLKGYTDLSNREKEILPLIALGYANKEIAAKLYISTKTVEAHKASINRKLGFKNRVDLVHYALHHGLIDF
jgi:two-component system response regulator NreC